MANKTHKYRTSKKLSPGPVVINTQGYDLKPPRAASKPPKLCKVASPTHSTLDDDQRVKKRRRKQLRKQERDSKSSLNQETLSPIPKLIHTHSSVDLIDYTPSSDNDLLTASLQTSLLVAWRESTNSLKAESSRPRRVQSDFSITSQALDERQYCPPDRKKFYRSFINTLKHSKISHMTRPHNEAVPMNPVLHVARMRSENLAMENPFGDVWEHIWLELKAYLSDKEPELYEEWRFYEAHHIEGVLRQVIDFRMPTIDPVLSLNSAFLGVEDEAQRGRSIKQVSFSEEVTRGQDDHASPDCSLCPQDSVSSEESSTVKYELCDFLSQQQLAAKRHVCSLLQELEDIEYLFPNRRKMGDEYANYRTLNFRRRVGALVLWAKVTCGLANKLCSLSTWLGVQVELRDVCNTPDQSEYDVVHPPLTNNEAEVSGILVTSPKSPSNRRARFTLHSQSSDDDQNPLTHQSSIGRSTNSTSTLQRLFSNYQSVLDNQGPYREFVNRGLKKKGLNYFMNVSVDSLYVCAGISLACLYSTCVSRPPAIVAWLLLLPSYEYKYSVLYDGVNYCIIIPCAVSVGLYSSLTVSVPIRPVSS